MNQENGAPRPVRRPPNSSGSLLIIVIIVFMMLSGNDDTKRVTQEDIRDSLQSLKDEHSNYTAWISGKETNFTLNEETPATHNLIGAFQHILPVPPTVTAGYYHNITGTYKTKNVLFHNISDPPVHMSWTELAQTMYSGKNLTRVHERAEGWNWTQPLETSMSIFSYRSNFTPGNFSNLQRFRGYMEIEPPNPNKGFMDNPSLTLRMEGIYLSDEGKVVALVEPKSIMPDIRQLAGLVSHQYRNVTANTIAAQLMERIGEMEKELSTGSISIEAEEPSVPCSFTLHGQMQAIHLPQPLIDEYEEELRSPSGVPVRHIPPPNFNGVLFSEDCGILMEMETIIGKTSLVINHRTISYAAITSIVYYILIQLSLSLNDQWRTATTLLQGSRGVMATWLIADSYAAISHLMAAVFTKDGRLALLVPGFLGCILLITDLRLLTLLNSVQFVLNQEEPAQPAQPVAPTANTTLSNEPSAQPTTEAATTLVSSGLQEPPQRNIVNLAKSLLRHAFANDFRAWLMINAIFSVVCMITLGLPLFGVWFLLISSTWCAQITRNIYQRTRRAVRHDTVVISSIVRLFSPLYLFACPDNLLDIQPASWVWILPIWVAFQVLLLIGQDYLGPLWFLPTLNSGPRYDYHPDLTKPDEEAVEPKLGDCTICMESISADQGYVPSQSNGRLQLYWREVTKKRRVYALAPCGHNFHTTCLEQWMEIKSVCPQCRRALPPL